MKAEFGVLGEFAFDLIAKAGGKKPFLAPFMPMTPTSFSWAAFRTSLTSMMNLEEKGT